MNKHALKEYNYESISPGYYEKIYLRRKGIQSKWHHLRFEGIHMILKGLPYGSLLDVACGPGTFLSTLPQNKQLYGIDISETQIAYARGHASGNKPTFYTADAGKIPLPDNSVDIIICSELIEHIAPEKINDTFLEMKRCLKPKGYLILTTPNYQSFWPFLEWIVSNVSPVNYSDQHVYKFTTKILQNFLTGQGFSDVHIRPYLFFSPFFASINWELSSRLFDFEFQQVRKHGNLLLTIARKE